MFDIFSGLRSGEKVYSGGGCFEAQGDILYSMGIHTYPLPKGGGNGWAFPRTGGVSRDKSRERERERERKRWIR